MRKTKRMLALLLTMAMVLSLLPTGVFAADTVVSSEAELRTALERGDAAITLGADITPDYPLVISSSVVLDLGGHTIHAPAVDGYVALEVNAEGGQVAIRNGKIGDDATGANADWYNAMTVASGVLTLSGVTLSAAYGTLAVNGGTVDSIENCQIDSFVAQAEWGDVYGAAIIVRENGMIGSITDTKLTSSIWTYSYVGSIERCEIDMLHPEIGINVMGGVIGSIADTNISSQDPVAFTCIGVADYGEIGSVSGGTIRNMDVINGGRVRSITNMEVGEIWMDNGEIDSILGGFVERVTVKESSLDSITGTDIGGIWLEGGQIGAIEAARVGSIDTYQGNWEYTGEGIPEDHPESSPGSDPDNWVLTPAGNYIGSIAGCTIERASLFSTLVDTITNFDDYDTIFESGLWLTGSEVGEINCVIANSYTETPTDENGNPILDDAGNPVTYTDGGINVDNSTVGKLVNSDAYKIWVDNGEIGEVANVNVTEDRFATASDGWNYVGEGEPGEPDENSEDWIKVESHSVIGNIDHLNVQNSALDLVNAEVGSISNTFAQGGIQFENTTARDLTNVEAAFMTYHDDFSGEDFQDGGIRVTGNSKIGNIINSKAYQVWIDDGEIGGVDGLTLPHGSFGTMGEDWNYVGEGVPGPDSGPYTDPDNWVVRESHNVIGNINNLHVENSSLVINNAEVGNISNTDAKAGVQISNSETGNLTKLTAGSYTFTPWDENGDPVLNEDGSPVEITIGGLDIYSSKTGSISDSEVYQIGVNDAEVGNITNTNVDSGAWFTNGTVVGNITGGEIGATFYHEEWDGEVYEGWNGGINVEDATVGDISEVTITNGDLRTGGMGVDWETGEIYVPINKIGNINKVTIENGGIELPGEFYDEETDTLYMDRYNTIGNITNSSFAGSVSLRSGTVGDIRNNTFGADTWTDEEGNEWPAYSLALFNVNAGVIAVNTLDEYMLIESSDVKSIRTNTVDSRIEIYSHTERAATVDKIVGNTATLLINDNLGSLKGDFNGNWSDPVSAADPVIGEISDNTFEHDGTAMFAGALYNGGIIKTLGENTLVGNHDYKWFEEEYIVDAVNAGTIENLEVAAEVIAKGTEEYPDEGPVDYQIIETENWNLLDYGDIDEMGEPETPESAFTDAEENSWYYKYITWAEQNGFMSGTSNTTFSPNGTMTRGMFAAILWRIAGKPEPEGENPFTDIDPDNKNHYYAKAVIWAAENGYISGTTTKTFSPNDNVTRGQAAAILYRMFGYGILYEDQPFTDIDLTNPNQYYAKGAAWASTVGVVSGYTDHTYRPNNNMTRAEGAAILQRCVAKLGLGDDFLEAETE